MPIRVPSIAALRALRGQTRSDCTRHAHSLHSQSPGKDYSRHNWAGCVARTQNGVPKRAGSEADRVRYTSHVASVTSVNAAARVPPAFQELHAALKNLEQSSLHYANIAQLSLALRGLESEDATIRAAVLSLDSLKEAKHLLRALLADPLGDEQEWEHTLSDNDEGGQALLLRYAEEFSVDDRNPALRMLSIPSTLLRTYRLEILIHQIDPAAALGTVAGESTQRTENLLDLNLGSDPERGSRLVYPVHKALILGKGLNGARHVFQILGTNASSNLELVHGAVSVQWQDAAIETTPSDLSIINVQEANEAVAAFRQSLENAFKYEHGWLNSNVASLLPFLSGGTGTEEGMLKPALHHYIALALQGVEDAILSEETERLNSLTVKVLSPTKQTELLRALVSWSEFAHRELRDELAAALQSRTWRKIRWWKLGWRVDDIALVLSDILQRSYLVNAERYLLWLGGYFRSAGLELADHHPALDAARGRSALESNSRFGAIPTQAETLRMVHEDVNEAQALSRPKVPSPASVALNVDDSTVSVLPLDPALPWPQQITASRNSLLGLIPPLQRTAQAIVARTLATIGLSTTIGALAFVGVSDTSGYSASAVAAFGSAWALSAAQKQWNAAKDQWVLHVQEEGRRTLESCERRGRQLIEDRIRAGEDQISLGGENAEERLEARTAVAEARAALERLSNVKV